MSVSSRRMSTKFGGIGFQLWASEMEEVLKENRVWKYSSGREPKPIPHAPGPDDAVGDADKFAKFAEVEDRWLTGDESAQGVLGGGLEESSKKKSNTWEHRRSAGIILRRSMPQRTTSSSFNPTTRPFSKLDSKGRHMQVSDAILAMRMIHSIGHKDSVWETLKLQALNLENDATKLSPITIREFFLSRSPLVPPSIELSNTSSSTALVATSVECWKKSHDELKSLKAKQQSTVSTGHVPSAHIAHVPPPSFSYINTASSAIPNDVGFFCGIIQPVLAANINRAANTSPSFKEAINVDCGCNVHISCIRGYFDDESFEALVTPIPIKIGDGSYIHATHRGEPYPTITQPQRSPLVPGTVAF
ncbi:hypothetical protein FRC14_002033 [Serendipita sp. 396]|nr:hypothetical protein FRC14_002033 [Serendipita sp. 396]KAG8787054.1 hypothetical protein FRC15_010130 [Serendipita sp. 397]KAG8869096.1 hypothetical protein FRC20_002118 [Serendipita sp. 405]